MKAFPTTTATRVAASRLVRCLATSLVLVSTMRALPLNAEDFVLPELTLHGLDMGRYYPSASVAVGGTLSRPLDTDIRVRLYHVQKDGKLLLMAGTTTKVDSKGRFSTMVEPGAGGWKPGTMRVEAVVERLSQVSMWVDKMVVDANLPPVQGVDPVVASDAIVEIDKIEPPVWKIPLGQLFRVRGRFRWMPAVKGAQGPMAGVTIVRFDPVLKQEIIAQTASAVSFASGDGTNWYEVEVRAPELPGEFGLETNAFQVDGEPGRTALRRTVIEVVNPK